MKAKTLFYCTDCGNELPKWAGQCPACKAWNTIVEQPVEKPAKRSGPVKGGSATGVAINRPRPMKEVETTDELRFATGMGELDRVLGGGEGFPGAGRWCAGYRQIHPDAPNL